MQTRRTRIICTIGPACADLETLLAMLDAGMDVARLNFSHGDHASHAETIALLRQAAARRDRPLALLQDLQGPKIRIEGLAAQGLTLQPGQFIDLTGSGSPAVADPACRLLHVSYPEFHQDVQPGMEVLLDDGRMILRAISVTDHRVRCEVLHGGHLQPRKGVNLPDTVLSTAALTSRDRADLAFGIQQGIDLIALSFVQRPDDITEVRTLIEAAAADIPVIAKIEKPQAVAEFDSILAVADGIMIARGDLGVEVPPEEVPLIQKDLIRRAIDAAVPVITATQMLESMIHAPRPTRAEASDVANAVLDATDAVMLSAETASGSHPVQAVRMMSRIVTLTEADLVPRQDFPFQPAPPQPPVPLTAPVPPDPAIAPHSPTSTPVSPPRHLADLAVAYAACQCAAMTRAVAIVCLTGSGTAARAVARFRPSTPLVALTHSAAIQRQLSLVWGVRALLLEDLAGDVEAAIDSIYGHLTDQGIAAAGDRIVLTAGLPFNIRGTINTLRIETIPAP